MSATFPPFMKRRHEVLRKIYSLLVNKKVGIGEIFDFHNSVHADLELSWIHPEFQEKNFGSTKDYQIVIATVKPGQTSDAHLHEIGASSFIVLGPKAGSAEPENLTYRIGELEFPSGSVKITNEIKCSEELEMDIPSYRIHQFENKSDKPAQILIVTHPIISVEEGKEDIHFAFKK